MAKGDYDTYLLGRSLRGVPSRRWSDGASKRQLNELPKTRAELPAFLEESDSPIAARMWNDRLVGYKGQTGEIEIDKERVKREAAAVDRRGVTALEYGEEVQGVKYAAMTRGEELTDNQAVGKLNREYQTRAAAVLLAADMGEVKLTEAQRANLKTMRAGHYDEFVNKPRAVDKNARGKSRGDERYEANKRDFIANVASQKGIKRRKLPNKKPTYAAAPEGASGLGWVDDELARAS